jgi:hypothetical protein
MWSIGIYTGDSPFQLQPQANQANPVLTSANVTDVPAEFVADPFMIKHAGRWHMFFEVKNRENERGEIGLATSDDAFNWSYQQIVLKEPFHLSYPYVFEWQGDYKADDFPTRWSLQQKLIDGAHADPSLVYFDNLWWLFVCSNPYGHDVLRLYFARDLEGPWKEHPRSPIVRGDKCRARPAGRILILNDKVIRFAQECAPQYGTRVRAFNISLLSRQHYLEVEDKLSPVLSPGKHGWNGFGMHHLDAQRQHDGKWIACVDGRDGRDE